MNKKAQKTFGKSFIKNQNLKLFQSLIKSPIKGVVPMPPKIAGHKGQEEGPFELLVAVVLMTFVIVVGIQAMDALRFQTCEGKSEKALEDLRSAIESSVNRNAFTQVNFSYEKCYRPNKDNSGNPVPEVLLFKKADLRQCRAICGAEEETCSFLELSNERLLIQKCLNIPYNTDFDTQARYESSCPEINGFTPVSFSSLGSINQGIQTGYYNFVPASTSETFPVICVYLKQTG